MNKTSNADRYKDMLEVWSIPDNIAEYVGTHYANLQANICNTDVEGGYGQRITKSIHLFLYYEKCNNCEYHSLWNPDDSETGCRARGGRHTLKRGWEQVFVWSTDSGLSLESAFQKWLDLQPPENRALPKKYLSVMK